MNKKSNFLYGLIYFLLVLPIIIFMAYVFIGTYNNVPLSSLISGKSKAKLVDLPTDLPSPSIGKKTTSVKKFTLPNQVVYVVTGKFVTSPTYNTKNVLQGYFMIDQDPTFHKSLVILGKKGNKVVVGTSQGSFDGKTTVSSEPVDDLRSSIKANSSVQLRFSIGQNKSAYDTSLQMILDAIMRGSWSIPIGFVLTPSEIGVVQ